jgi:hypothetical protein
MILVGHVARIMLVSNTCNLLAESIDGRIFVGYVARIMSVSNACNLFGRKQG